MSEQTAVVGDVDVRVDNRVRLVSAVLAATNYPESAQKLKPHGTHAHARATRKYLKDHKGHPAAALTQDLLDKGAPLEALFTLALHLDPATMQPAKPLPTWVPADWGSHMADFYQAAQLAQWWESERYVWDKSVTESKKVFNGVNYRDFLRPYFGVVNDRFVFMPNVSYPSGHEVGLRYEGELICITPPPLAWGDSPPWPYDEDTMVMHSYRASLVQFGKILLMTYLRANPDAVEEASKHRLPVNDQFRAQFPGWEDQFSELFVTALVAMYLKEFVSDREFKAFVLMERKVRGMNILPGTVSVIRRFLQEKGKENKYDNLMEFLPIFPKQLRIAKAIVNL